MPIFRVGTFVEFKKQVRHVLRHLWDLVTHYFPKKWHELKMTTSIMKQQTLTEITKKITGQEKLKYNQSAVIAFGNGGYYSFGSGN